MYVRKRKAARKKRKDQAENPDGTLPVPDEDVEHEEDIQAEKDMPSYAEHAFTFTAFERVSPDFLRGQGSALRAIANG